MKLEKFEDVKKFDPIFPIWQSNLEAWIELNELKNFLKNYYH